MREHYLLELVWLAGAQLYALGGGKDYPMPDPSALFPPEPPRTDQRDAQAIRQEVLSLVKGRKEDHHGQAV